MVKETLYLKTTYHEAQRMGCRRRSVTVNIVDEGDSVELQGTYWSGGSRNRYALLTPDGRTQGLMAPLNPPQFGGGEAPRRAVMHTGAVLRTGTFNGREAFPSVTCTREWLEASFLKDCPAKG